MTASLRMLAEFRLAKAGSMPQRYGLSVFLRKPYPRLDQTPEHEKREARSGVSGASVEVVTWDVLPQDIGALLRQRVTDDSLLAFHVVHTERVYRIPIVGEQSLDLLPMAGATVFIDVAPGARLVVMEGTHARGRQNNLQSALIIVRMGAGAHVRWYGHTVRSSGFTAVERLVVLERDAMLEQHAAFLQPDVLRENIHVVLDAPGATAEVHTVFAGSADDQFDLGVTAEHRAPHTKSNLAAKGVLAGKSQAVYRGLVRVGREAHGSDGYQRCDTLLLSPTAEVDPVPNLEINTDDVRCTHGVTVSSLNADQLFYLQSRGYSPVAARQLLVKGFCGKMLEAFPAEKRATLEQEFHALLTESI